jgi:NUDIX domain
MSDLAVRNCACRANSLREIPGLCGNVRSSVSRQRVSRLRPGCKGDQVTDYVHRIRALVGSGELLQLPSASVAIRDVHGRVLLARHSEGDRWVLPGGAIEPGETPADAAVREAWEETGGLVRLTRLVGVFGGSHVSDRGRSFPLAISRPPDEKSAAARSLIGTVEGG